MMVCRVQPRRVHTSVITEAAKKYKLGTRFRAEDDNLRHELRKVIHHVANDDDISRTCAAASESAALWLMVSLVDCILS